MNRLSLIATAVILFAGGEFISSTWGQDQAEKNRQTSAAPADKSHDRPEDRAALEAINAEFTRAFNAGDAVALTVLFTDDARLSDEAGRTVEGRAAIRDRLADGFRNVPGAQIVLRTDSINFLSPDVAIEEGASQLRLPNDADPDAAEFTPYTAIYVKRDGKWLHAVVRDYIVEREDAPALSGAEALQELEWMVGDWVEEGSNSKSVSRCEWAQNNHFLVWNYTIEAEGANAPGGTSYIGWDPLSGQIKSWVFDAQGGHGEATWTRHGEGQWVVKTSGVLGDGRTASATQYVTRLGDDLASWTSVDRVAGDQVQPDLSEYIITRLPPRPVSAAETAPSN